MRPAFGVWIAAGLVLLSTLTSQWVRSGYRHEIRPPSKDVRKLPESLGDWSAVEEWPLDERTADVLGADAFISRVYTNAAGESVSVQVAVWSDHSAGPTGLHYPEVCYRNAGWQLIETVSGVVRTPNGGERPMRLMLMEKSGERIVTAHWYQMSDSTFFSANEARVVHRRFWGIPNWPAEVKVLIQTSAQDIESATPRLDDFAAAIASWTDDLH